MEKCAICKTTLNKVDKEGSNKNSCNAAIIAKERICGACNNYELMARLNMPFISVDFDGFNWKYHKEWHNISRAREVETVKWIELVADKMIDGKTQMEAIAIIKG